MPTPERYAVIGHPIAHSLSPRIHALFAQQTHQNLSYQAFDVPPPQLSQWLPDFFAQGGRGLNATVPHKQALIALIDRLSECARTAGAVNTVTAGADGVLMGDNTDGVGLVRDLLNHLHLPITGQRLLLLGAGGAARGALAPLLELKPQQVVIANRSTDRAVLLADEFAPRGSVQGMGIGALDGLSFDLIINATSAGLQGDSLPLPASLLSRTAAYYDMSYGRGDTPFMRWARAGGAAQIYFGLGMLVEQAAESFHIWRGVRPHTASVLAALTRELG